VHVGNSLKLHRTGSLTPKQLQSYDKLQQSLESLQVIKVVEGDLYSWLTELTNPSAHFT
jgi:hypothetical protein